MTNRLLTLLGITFALYGCGTVQTFEPPAESNRVAGDPAKPAQKPELPAASFEPETLYALLVAELAGQRKRYDVLLSSYLHQAAKTRDRGIAERATRIAMFLKADKAALSAAELWAEVDPDEIRAQQALSVQYVKAGKFRLALALMADILEQGGQTNFEYLAANTKDLSQTDRNQILDKFNELLTTHPDHEKLLFAKTILLEASGRTTEALETASLLDEIKHDSQTIVLKVKLQHQLGKTDLALSTLEKELEANPQDKQFRLLYAQLLIDIKKLDLAQQEFVKLVELSPDDGQLRLTLALLAVENAFYDYAKTQLNLLTEDPELRLDAHYYLAQIEDRDRREEAAIEHYRQVTSGSKAVSAHTRLGEILISQNRLQELQTLFDEARKNDPEKAKTYYIVEANLLAKNEYLDTAIALLNVALSEYEDDFNLLYARAMTAERQNDLAAMESDLRKILGLQPDNAMVLNTLGYTLADRTTRYDEAYELIQRAYELKPDDPAITDSLGWAMFRLGNYEESIRLLEKAFAEFPDHEVAAHLGEVLWISGQHQRARKIFEDALERTPDSPILKRVIDRLNPLQSK